MARLKRTDLRVVSPPSPIRRKQPIPYEEYHYRTGAIQYLPAPTRLAVSLRMALLERWCKPIRQAPSDQDLSTLLWTVGKTLSQRVTLLAHERWEHRGVPSAGGKHPIDLLVMDWTRTPGALHLYDPLSHSLRVLKGFPSALNVSLSRAAEACVGWRAGLVIWHVVQVARTASAYRYPDTLIWRDSGVLTGAMAIVSAAVGLSCVPLGITGEPWLSRGLKANHQVMGGGGAVIGTPSAAPRQPRYS